MPNASLPRLVPIRQIFESAPAPVISDTLRRDLGRLSLGRGARVGVAVGSRGIGRLQEIVREVVRHLREAGARPFIIPAMGSHGGATPEGQAALLAEYGITEEVLGVPVCASMEVRVAGKTTHGAEVFLSAEALGADGLVIINRVKPHTDFAGEIGSGILKMMAIGLGKRVGAASLHASAGRYGHESVLLEAGRIAWRALPVIGAVAIVENPRHEPAIIEVIPGPDIESREKRLMVEARRLLPLIPIDDIDLLVVDWLGKNISGAGMDPNVIFRSVQGYSSSLSEMRTKPVIRRIFVRDLTPESRGNAIGIGLADFTSSRLARAMDREVTFLNSVTALTHQCAKMPVHFERDADTIASAVSTLALPAGVEPRVVQIQDTLNLELMRVSENLLGEVEGRSDLLILGPPAEPVFDSEGRLAPVGE